jgi:hypothetical protein
VGVASVGVTGRDMAQVNALQPTSAGCLCQAFLTLFGHAVDLALVNACGNLTMCDSVNLCVLVVLQAMRTEDRGSRDVGGARNAAGYGSPLVTRMSALSFQVSAAAILQLHCWQLSLMLLLLVV